MFLLALFAYLCTSRVAATTDCVVCVLGLALVQQLAKNYTSDPERDCKALGFCSSSPADSSCTLFNGTWPVAPAPFPSDGGAIDERRRLLATASSLPTREHVLAFLAHLREHPARGFSGVVASLSRWLAGGAPPCSDGLDIVCDFERPFDQHLPMIDHDNDAHAGDPLAGDFLTLHLRGRDWRGRDCNDSDAAVYPGRVPAGGDASVDTNCNGIVGVEPASGTPYEQLWCSGDNAPMGLAILGDSAAAHFHIPPQYLNAPSWNLTGLVELAANEADWPACSWATAFRNASACPALAPLMGVPPQSFYQRWLARNRCAHRDFNNVGVNGARTGSMAPPNGVINALQRNASADTPLLVIYALIGGLGAQAPAKDASKTDCAPKKHATPTLQHRAFKQQETTCATGTRG